MIVRLLIVQTILNLKIFVTQTQPNVLFIVVDDLRPALGAYGDKNAFTPNIDKLAKKSVTFNNTFAQQSLCGPSRNSMLTGRRPDTLRLYDTHNYWRKTVGNFTTLPQFFKVASYITHSVGKVFHPGISSNHHDDYPYSWTLYPFHPISEKYKNSKVCPVRNSKKLYKNIVCPVNIRKQPGRTLPDIEILDESVRFLKTHGDEPYFLAVGFHKPHIPLKFPKKFLKYHNKEKFRLPLNRRKPSTLPNIAYNPWQDLRERDDIFKLNLTFPYQPIPDDYALTIIQSYYASVSYIDSLVGKLLSHIDFNTTIVLLTSDHGWSMSDHGEWSKFSNYEIATKVPLIIFVPNLTENGYQTNNIVELIDIFPTLVQLYHSSNVLKPCLVNTFENLCAQGQSLYPLIKCLTKNGNCSRLSKGVAYSQYPRPSMNPQNNSDQPDLADIKYMGYSIRNDRYRYTRWMKFDSATFKSFWDETYGEELYDHQTDPLEDRNQMSNSSYFEIKVILSEMLRKTMNIAMTHSLRK